MKEIEAIFIELLQDKKKRLYLIGGALLALLLIVLLLVSILGGSGRKYNKYYNEAEKAYVAGDYASAEEKLRRAMDLKSTEKAYLLMADIYCAQGQTDRAIQLLYLGYSHIGGTKIEKRLDELKNVQGSPSITPMPQGSVTIAGNTMDGNVTSLVLTGTRLKEEDLTAISTLSRLESLGLSDCSIRNVSFLSGLNSLTFLQISDNKVADLTPLAGLKVLKTLYIDNNPITDFSPLYGLSGLRTLSMKGIDVTLDQLDKLREALPECSVYADEPISEVREIKLGGKAFNSDVTELELCGLGITDISALSECTKLEKLDVRDNEISDLSPLVDLPNLKWLCIRNNKAEDINPLLSLGALEYLDADGNRISDISVLEYLPQLRELWLNHNPLSSVVPLRSLKGLTELGLDDTGLDDDDLDSLMGMTALLKLNIKGNKSISAGKFEELQSALPNCEIKHDELLFSLRLGEQEYRSDAERIDAASMNIDDLSGLEKFTLLRILNLNANRITDLSPLAGLSKLEELRLKSNAVNDLSALSSLKSLKVLNLRSNAVVSLAPLAGCDALTELDLCDNRITDLTPLSFLTHLDTLDLSYNQITDLSALYSLSSLRQLDLRGNPLTEDDIAALSTALPGCTVFHDAAGGSRPTPASGSDLR